MVKKKDPIKEFEDEILHILAKYQTENLTNDTIFYELEDFREILVSWRNNEKSTKKDTRDRTDQDKNQLEIPGINQD